jgi:hypothetical protein
MTRRDPLAFDKRLRIDGVISRLDRLAIRLEAEAELGALQVRMRDEQVRLTGFAEDISATTFEAETRRLASLARSTMGDALAVKMAARNMRLTQRGLTNA